MLDRDVYLLSMNYFTSISLLAIYPNFEDYYDPDNDS